MKYKFILCLLLSTYAQAQINGTVTAQEDGQPLPGVSVVVQGTTKGVVTDFDGKYTLENVDETATLKFIYIGYKTQNISVNRQKIINVALITDTATLNEVVVTSYGNINKKDATGAVDVVSSSTFDQVAAPSPAQLLRGKVSGVQITSSSGEPGAGVSIRVRGTTSIRSGNNPLIVVDGVPLGGGNVSSGISDSDNNGIAGSSAPRNPLNFINANDIETISVLKDASSTAIYGSRGSNGVIVITTKRPATGEKTSISYATSVGTATFATPSSYKGVMNKEQYIAAGGQDNNGNFDWQKELFRTALTQTHDLTLSTSGKNSSTRVSIGANLQNGIIKETGFDRYSVSFFNTAHFFDDVLKVDSRMIYSKIQDQSQLITNNAGFSGNLIASALYWRPSLSVYDNTKKDINGGYTAISGTDINPVHLLNAYDDNTTTDKLLASVMPTVKITENIDYKMLLGIERSNSIRGIQLSPTVNLQGAARATGSDGTEYRGQASLYNDERENYTVEHTLNYKKNFSNDLFLDALVGYSYYQYLSSGNQLHAKGFNAEQTNLLDNLQGVANSAGAYSISSYKNKVELQSYYVRVLSTYKSFLLTATIRSDGSTKLGEANKYGYFPSVGVGYKIFEDKEGAVNTLKLRSNWGITGNQEFDPNSAVSKVNYTNTVLVLRSNANPDLKWETTTSTGVGLDFTLLNSKLKGSLDYFYRNTKDLIFPFPQASTQPGPNTPRFVNLPGKLVNNGLEAALTYTAIEKEDFGLDFSGNIAFLSNTIQDFSPFILAGGLSGQGLSSANSQTITNNKPIYSYYLFEFTDYDANGNSQYKQSDGSPGSLSTAVRNVLDKQALPKVNAGISLNARYKNLDLSTSFYGSFGHYIYNNTTNALFAKSALEIRNISKAVADSPQSTADPNTPSTKYLEKGDFMRWSNLSLGYTFSDKFTQKIKATYARLYLSVNNLAVFTNYSGFDPEVNTVTSIDGVPSFGIDYLSYPRSRNFAVGLNVRF